jgi:RNA polymerase sigma-70 factor (ECF subfamily)
MLTTVTSTDLLDGLRREGDDRAWREFCVRYEPALLAFARRAGLREQDARDVVQETFMAFLESFRDGRYDPRRGRLRSWLKGIILNKIREARRRLAGREVQVLDRTDTTAFMDGIPDDRELTDVFDEEWERGVLAECLREVRQQVDAPTYQAFELYAVKSWPPEKVAEQLGISRNAVYISKSRVLSRLRELQQEMSEIW